MISSKLSLLAMIALFCMIFIDLSQTAPLNKRQKVGEVAFADFTDGAEGRFTWTNIPGNRCRVTGQFNKGLEDPDVNNYELLLVDQDGNVIQDMTPEFKQITINPPGGSAFEKDFPSSLVTVEDVLGLKMVLKHKGNTIDEADIKRA
jgi:hypothetical protein